MVMWHRMSSLGFRGKEKAVVTTVASAAKFRFYQSVFRNRASVSPSVKLSPFLSGRPVGRPADADADADGALISLSRRYLPSLHFRRHGRWSDGGEGRAEEGGKEGGRELWRGNFGGQGLCSRHALDLIGVSGMRLQGRYSISCYRDKSCILRHSAAVCLPVAVSAVGNSNLLIRRPRGRHQWRPPGCIDGVGPSLSPDSSGGRDCFSVGSGLKSEGVERVGLCSLPTVAVGLDPPDSPSCGLPPSPPPLRAEAVGISKFLIGLDSS